MIGDSGRVVFVLAEGTHSEVSLIETTAPAVGGDDVIDVADGDNIVLAGVADDVVTSLGGDDWVVGDNGRVGFFLDATFEPEVSVIETHSPLDAGDDVIGAGSGDNIVLAGGGKDRVTTLEGIDWVIGDSGRVVFVLAEGTHSEVSLIETTAPAVGGDDVIDVADGDNIVLAGVADDVVTSLGGDDWVVGDNGRVGFFLDATFEPEVSVIETHSPLDAGDDVIGAGSGDNIVLAGGGKDRVTTLEGIDWVIGDSGRVVFVLAEGTHSEVSLIETTAPAVGGDDVIDVADGDNIVLAGVADDVVTSLGGDDWVVGDNGRVGFFLDATFEPEVSVIETHSPLDAGDDVIGAGSGDNIVLAGGGKDRVTTLEGIDWVIGDSGRVSFDLVEGTHPEVMVIETTDPASGGDDWISVAEGHDIVLGGSGADEVRAAAGDDIVLGDNGRVTFRLDPMFHSEIDRITTTDLNFGGADLIVASEGEDVVAGGSAGDTIEGAAGDDLLFGDQVDLFRRVGDITNPRFMTLLADLIYSRADRPGSLPPFTPLPDGFIAGILYNQPDWLPSALAEMDGQLLVDGIWRDYRDADGGAPQWALYLITNLWHTAAIEAGNDPVAGPNSFGDDYIAGGAGDDTIFGQLGNDVIQGDGSIDSQQAGAPAGAARTPDGPGDPLGPLTLSPSFDAATDGDDYVEGGGGNDVIFGNLGQDDLVGGSSALFTLTTPAQRPDGDDIVFGGSGTRVDRNAEVPADTAGRHARDADVIVADNGDIHRLVGTGGSEGSDEFLGFNYDLNGSADDGYGPLRIIARGVRLIDHTAGGPDYRPDLFGTDPVIGCGRDSGGNDEVHGEAGDDTVYGGCGNDSLYGDSEDDDLIGGWGHDWISGGTGQDGILGDDGRIWTSRVSAGYGEPLYGIEPLPAEEIDRVISAQFGMQVERINLDGELKKTVNLAPFNLTPLGSEDDPYFDPVYADDIIFGGLGADFLHGGSGDDAVSGAEALMESYGQRYDSSGQVAGTVRIDFTRPYNPGDALHFGPDDDSWRLLADLDTGLSDTDLTSTAVDVSQAGLASRLGDFALYDEYDPRRKVQLGADGRATKDGSGGEWFLNFRAADDGAVPQHSNLGWGTVVSDGDDAIFGDLGNDWMVGGTGRDTIWSGFGNDLANADDDLDTAGGLNDRPDTHPSYEDRVFGGAGLDILMANTAGDRLIDWQGDFNSFIVPFSWYSAPTISRWYVPKADEALNHLFGLSPLFDPNGCFLAGWENEDGCVDPSIDQFLYLLSESQGADPTRAIDTGEDPERRGEPHGELGLVTPYDEPYWHDQTGLPSDPPGFIPFQRRDVLYSAAYEDPTTLSFTPIDDQLFGGTHLLDLFFGYDGIAHTLGAFHFEMGGPGHDLVVSLTDQLELTIDITGVHLDAAGLALDFDYGLRTPDPDAGDNPLVGQTIFLFDPLDYLLDLEDAVSSVFESTISEAVLGDLSLAVEHLLGGAVDVVNGQIDLVLPVITPVVVVLTGLIPLDTGTLTGSLLDPLAPTIDSLQTTLTTTLGSLAGSLTAPLAGQSIAPTDVQLQGLVNQLTAPLVADPTTSALGAALAEPANTLIPAATETVAAITTPSVTEPLAGALAPVLEPLGPAIVPLVAPIVPDLVATVAPVVAPTVAPLLTQVVSLVNPLAPTPTPPLTTPPVPDPVVPPVLSPPVVAPVTTPVTSVLTPLVTAPVTEIVQPIIRLPLPTLKLF